MKKKLIVFIAIFVSSACLFAKSSNFLLQLDTEINYFQFLDSEEKGFSIYPMPVLEVDYKLPTSSSFKSYLGFQVLPAIPFYSVAALVNDRFGYAFKKPEKWNKYHIELLGNVGAGAVFLFWYGVNVLPLGDVGFQIFFMPEDKGFFWGAGPDVICICENDFSSIGFMFSVSVNLGYKF